VLLYDNAESGNCYKVRLLLAQLEIPFQRRELSTEDRSDRADVLGALNPGLRIPTLVFDDGRSLGESDAILFHLAEGTRYLPTDAFARAQVLQWMFFEQYSHEPNLAVLRFRANHGVASDPAEYAARRTAGEAALAAMEAHLRERDWVVGEAYSIAG
jgi:glutathione S-transferase